MVREGAPSMLLYRLAKDVDTDVRRHDEVLWRSVDINAGYMAQSFR